MKMTTEVLLVAGLAAGIAATGAGLVVNSMRPRPTPESAGTSPTVSREPEGWEAFRREARAGSRLLGIDPSPKKLLEAASRVEDAYVRLDVSALSAERLSSVQDVVARWRLVEVYCRKYVENKIGREFTERDLAQVAAELRSLAERLD